LGSHWWIIAAGTFPIAFFSYWPAWRLDARIYPLFSFLLAVALSLAFQIAYLILVMTARHFISSTKQKSPVP
jgi:hypothetical protein